MSLRKAILTHDQLAWFQSSHTRDHILAYILALNDAVLNVKLTDDSLPSPQVLAVLNILDTVDQVAAEIPPVHNSASRFGNPAFRSFYDKVSQVRLPLPTFSTLLDASSKAFALVTRDVAQSPR